MQCWLVSNGHNFTPEQSLNWRHRSDLVENEHGSLISQHWSRKFKTGFSLRRGFFFKSHCIAFVLSPISVFQFCLSQQKGLFLAKILFWQKNTKTTKETDDFFLGGKGSFRVFYDHLPLAPGATNDTPATAGSQSGRLEKPVAAAALRCTVGFTQWCNKPGSCLAAFQRWKFRPWFHRVPEQGSPSLALHLLGPCFQES